MFKVPMLFKKETRNTMVYENNTDDAEITSLYIRKSAGKHFERWPKTIIVEVKSGGE